MASKVYRRTTLGLALCTALMVSGCLGYEGDFARGYQVDEDTLSQIKVGATTKPEALAALGTPSTTSTTTFKVTSSKSPAISSEDLELQVAKEIIRLSATIEATLTTTKPWYDLTAPTHSDGTSSSSSSSSSSVVASKAGAEQRYLDEMRELQFGEIDKFDVHHYKSSSSSSMAVGRRILLETSVWAAGGLPLNFESSVFLRKCERFAPFFFFFL